MTIQIDTVLGLAATLFGLTLVSSIGVCLYSLRAMKRYRHSIYLDGYVQGFIDAHSKEDSNDAD